MSQKTITINGRKYDAHTGLPADEPASPKSASTPHIASRAHTPHSKVHASAQKSHTLNRRVVKKDIAPAQVRTPAQKSHMISKFAKPPGGYKHPVAPATRDIAPQAHPLVTKATAQQQAHQRRTVATLQPSHVIKKQAIAEAIEKAPSKHEKNDVTPKKHSKFSRFASIASASLALLLLGGYFTYLNMPSLSVRVAAAHAGLDASYPEYKPDGYRLNGPVAYTEGQVSMKFAANAGPQAYSIDQSKSNWDSSAVLDNYVKKKAGENYITYNERGLTIYTFDGNAAWVNSGILYTISGDAPLSSDQIRRIATSM